MSLKEWLQENPCISDVDFTYTDKNGEIYCDFQPAKSILINDWDIPEGLLESDVVGIPGLELVSGSVISYVNCVCGNS